MDHVDYELTLSQAVTAMRDAVYRSRCSCNFDRVTFTIENCRSLLAFIDSHQSVASSYERRAKRADAEAKIANERLAELRKVIEEYSVNTERECEVRSLRSRAHWRKARSKQWTSDRSNMWRVHRLGIGRVLEAASNDRL